MRILIDFVITLPNATELLTSCVPGDGSPEGFYTNLGFEKTGELDGDEIIMRLPL